MPKYISNGHGRPIRGHIVIFISSKFIPNLFVVENPVMLDNSINEGSALSPIMSIQLTENDLQRCLAECQLKTRSKRVKDVVVGGRLCTAKIIQIGTLEYQLRKTEGNTFTFSRMPFLRRIQEIQLNENLVVEVMEKGIGLPELFSALPRLFLRLDFITSLLLDLCKSVRFFHINDLHHDKIQPDHVVFDLNLHANLAGLGNVKPQTVKKEVRSGDFSIYDAPEVRQGLPNVDVKAADIYSVGIILLEYLCGKADPAILSMPSLGPFEAIKKVLCSMVHTNPLKRPTASQIIYNPSIYMRDPQ
uniref:Protein kinase domain-containing protein n=1 Tax=Bursaphelenchus xylophilus TaxID=6326 RepID=A0A1I7RLC5_BURXY